MTNRDKETFYREQKKVALRRAPFAEHFLMLGVILVIAFIGALFVYNILLNV